MWKYIVEIIVVMAISFSTISLFYEFLKMKDYEKKNRRNRTEDPI